MDSVTNEQPQVSCYKDVKQFIPDYSLTRYESVVTGLENTIPHYTNSNFLKILLFFMVVLVSHIGIQLFLKTSQHFQQ